MILPPLGIEETQCGKFNFFPIGQNLREINGVRGMAKITILMIFVPHELDCDEILQFCMAEMDFLY